MNKIKALLCSPRTLEFLRYGIGCGCNFTIKMVLSSLLNLAGIGFAWAYFITHCVLLFCSFFYHHYVTFRRRNFADARAFFSEFLHYTLAVIGLKALDYLIVVIGSRGLESRLMTDSTPVWEQQLLHAFMIAFSCGAVFLLRYFVFRKIFHRKERIKS